MRKGCARIRAGAENLLRRYVGGGPENPRVASEMRGGEQTDFAALPGRAAGHERDLLCPFRMGLADVVAALYERKLVNRSPIHLKEVLLLENSACLRPKNSFR